ncbi:MAG: hypothetical protein WAW00_01360 [Candidatus Moraniibacteriota bacterium]
MRIRRHHFRMISSVTERNNRSIGPARKAALGIAGTLAGSTHTCILLVLLVVFVAGGGYLYSVNRSAVQGYHMRTLEKEIDRLKQDNAELKITEADLRSLYRIEASGEALGMEKLDAVIYLEERGPVALR